jgi:methyl-accepting chemotaxis protein
MRLSLPAPRSLRAKLVLILLPVTVVAVAALTWVAVSRSTDAQRDSAHNALLQQASREANGFDAQAREARAIGRTIAREMQAHGGATREDVSGMLHQILLANPRIAGTYVVFEPDALDGRDASYRAGHGTAIDGGAFGPYWNRLGGKVALEPLVGAYKADYYTLPKKQRRDVIIEPYLYETSLMTSYISPIERNGRFVGMGGVDVVLNTLNAEVSNIKVLDSGYAFAVSRTGIFVAAPDKRVISRQTLGALARKQHNAKLAAVAAGLRKGRSGVVETTDPFTGKDVTLAYAPVHTGGWGYVVSAPTSEVLAAAHALRTRLLIIGAVIILLTAAAIVLVAGRLTRPLGGFVARLRTLSDEDVASLRGGMEAIAHGDLTVPARTVTEPAGAGGDDEIGCASATLDELIANTHASVDAYESTRSALSRMIGDVAAGAGRVAAASQQMASSSEETGRAVGEIASAVGDVATGAERQVGIVESARTLTESVGARVRDSAETAKETTAAADRARSVAREGVATAAEATAAMSAVRGSSQAVRDAMDGLAGKSTQIGGIVQTITGIAEQTNLLALNAAIEAARAGEQGRGFAVVADEVRKLAEESQRAAASLGAIVAEIQDETGRAVRVVEEGAVRTDVGEATVEQARASFEAIGTAVEEVTERIAAIAAQAQEIATDADGVQRGIADVAAVAEESSASAQQVSASTQQTSASSQQIAASAQSWHGRPRSSTGSSVSSRPCSAQPPGVTTPAAPPPRRTGSAAASSVPSSRHSTASTAPISSTGFSRCPYVEASARPSGEATSAGSASAWAVFRSDTRGAAIAAGSGVPSPSRSRSTCATVVMFVAPPGEPSASSGRPSRCTIVGAIDERGRLPPSTRFGALGSS